MAQTNAPFIIEQNRQDRAPPVLRGQEENIPPPAPVTNVPAIKPFVLTAVDIKGTTLSPPILGAALQAYIGKTIDNAALTQIANIVSSVYGDAGDIALFTVTIPNQDFAGGLLHLQVTEGYIEHVDLAGDTGGDIGLVTAYANKLALEKPLRRSTLQRYLSLMRDIPGLTIDVKMLKGAPGGGVRMVVTLTQEAFHVRVGLNDTGNSLLGRYQGMLDFSLYGLLQQGEETKLTFGTSSVFSRYQYYGISESDPLGTDGTTAQVSLGYLRTKVSALGLAGVAKTVQVSVTHPLLRSFNENLSLTGDVDGIDTDNALFGFLLSTEKIRAARFGASYNLAQDNWLLASNATVSHGIKNLDAVVPEGGGQAGFSKLSAGARYNRVLGGQFVARLRVSAQVGFTALPTTELFSLGGPDFGRAFLTASALGDTGIAGSAELAWLPQFLPGFLSGTELLGFADDGHVWSFARPFPSLGVFLLPQDYTLASGGVGMRIPVPGGVKLDLEAANALSANAPGTHQGSWLFLAGLTSDL